MYRTQRNYENVQRMLFDGIGEYDIPQIEPTQFNNAEFIGFNYARNAKEPENKAVHFFLDDYQLPEYGQNRINTFRCCSDSSTC